VAEVAKTVDQAMRLLRSIAEDGPGPAGTLAARLGLNRTVVYRLLRTLEAHGAVNRQGSTFALGLELVRLGHAVESDLRDAARPWLEWLTERFGETAVLAVPDDGEAVAVDQVLPAGRMVQVHYRPGFRHPLARGAHGRAMLAFLPATLVERALAGLDDAAAVRRRLDEARRLGEAVSRDELKLGAAGLAAPVLDGSGVAVASIGVVAPAGRFVNDATLAAGAREAAAQASARLGHPSMLTAVLG
jgi:DNA-binding IclR family transcriptional regulator